jgi:CPA1 family monovalent cation:H+ antiporter
VLIQRLGIVTPESEKREELAARSGAAQAGLERLSTLSNDGLPPELIDDLRKHLLARSRHYGKQAGQSQPENQRSRRVRYGEVRRAVLEAEREAVIALRDQGTISDDVMRKIERELDLEEISKET